MDVSNVVRSDLFEWFRLWPSVELFIDFSKSVLEFIDEAWPAKNLLFPPMSEPLKRAQTRIHLDVIGKKIVPPFITLHRFSVYCSMHKLAIYAKSKIIFYTNWLYRSKDANDKENAILSLSTGLDEFFKSASSDGPFFLGALFSVIDISLAPFIVRFVVAAFLAVLNAKSRIIVKFFFLLGWRCWQSLLT